MSKHPDIIIIGAGIIGATCAWRLAQAGFQVTVLERNAPGSEASQAALGGLTFHAKPQMPAVFHQLCIRSRPFFLQIIEELKESVGERPSFTVGGQLRVALTESDLDDIEEAHRTNTALGVDVQRPTAEECRMLTPGLNRDILDALFFENDAWVDNTALTLAIVKAAEQAGALFERDTVRAVTSQNGRVTGAQGDRQSWSAGLFIVAAGCWSGQVQGIPSLPVYPVRGQALSVAAQPVRRLVMSPRGYLVPKGSGQTMLGATEEHRISEIITTLEGLHQVFSAALELAPALGTAEFLGGWAGLRPGTPDKLPFIGPFEEYPNLIAATGHFRNGILLAPITAELVRAVVTGEEPLLDLHPLRPDRLRQE